MEIQYIWACIQLDKHPRLAYWLILYGFLGGYKSKSITIFGAIQPRSYF